MYICYMILSTNDIGKCGIYCIVNTITKKMYVGKSNDIYQRMATHKYLLRKKSKDENRHLINSWHKYGEKAFSYKVLEYLEKDFELVKEQELYWILKLNVLDSNIGYNLRLDSRGGMIPSDETRRRLSKAQKKRWENPEARRKNGEITSKFWKENPKIKAQMSQKVSKAKEKYRFKQFENIGKWGAPKKGKLIKTYETVNQIIQENPSFKWQNIYAVCNGYKPTYMKYIWQKELKI